MVPFTTEAFPYETGALLFVPGIRKALETGAEQITGYVITGDSRQEITLYMQGLTAEERQILLDGCLMNYYRFQKERA